MVDADAEYRDQFTAKRAVFDFDGSCVPPGPIDPGNFHWYYGDHRSPDCGGGALCSPVGGSQLAGDRSGCD